MSKYVSLDTDTEKLLKQVECNYDRREFRKDLKEIFLEVYNWICQLEEVERRIKINPSPENLKLKEHTVNRISHWKTRYLENQQDLITYLRDQLERYENRFIRVGSKFKEGVNV